MLPHITPDVLLHAILKRCTFLPDEWFLRLQFKLKLGYVPNFKNPKSFNEKIQWIKLYERNPLMHVFCDKYAVKEYLVKEVGSEYVVPMLGAWDRFEDIDFESLPQRFVLKATNSGARKGVVICRDKSNFDKEDARRRLNAGLKDNFWVAAREWAYKGMHKRIIAEEYLEDSNGELKDYKFFCSNGKPQFLSVDYSQHKDHRSLYLDLDWNRLPFDDPGIKAPANHHEPKPENFDSMTEIARKLSEGLSFLRVDFYNVDNHIYIGELTCYHSAGCHSFDPLSADYLAGDCITLTNQEFHKQKK